MNENQKKAQDIMGTMNEWDECWKCEFYKHRTCVVDECVWPEEDITSINPVIIDQIVRQEEQIEQLESQLTAAEKKVDDLKDNYSPAGDPHHAIADHCIYCEKLADQLTDAEDTIKHLRRKAEFDMPEDTHGRFFNACTDPCDMIDGPCACGATHSAREWFGRLCRKLTTAEKREAVLAEFARQMIGAYCWNICEPDGGDMQEVAEKLGLLVPHIATAEDVDDEFDDYEEGDTIFKFSDILKSEFVGE